MVLDDGGGRHRRRGPPPRGGHRRPGRDRHALRHAGRDGRQGDACTSTSSRTSPPATATSATFMPKPLFGDNGSGMHTHQSLWKDGTQPVLRRGRLRRCCRDMARYYIGGLLKHAPALLAFAAPTTNSYRRLVPGYEAPINLVYSQRNRSACIRIPMYSTTARRRSASSSARPDPTCNPYLAFSAHADGRPGRHHEQDRAAGAGGQGHLRAAARGGSTRSSSCPARWTRCSTRWRRTTSSCSRATSSPAT